MPALPEFYPVKWHKKGGSYCVDPEAAKGLLKNRALTDGYEGDLREILEGMK